LITTKTPTTGATTATTFVATGYPFLGRKTANKNDAELFKFSVQQCVLLIL